MVFATVVLPEPVPPAMPTTKGAISGGYYHDRSGIRTRICASMRAMETAHHGAGARENARHEEARPRRAALFDLDRTLVRKETASLYVRSRVDSGEATW